MCARGRHARDQSVNQNNIAASSGFFYACEIIKMGNGIDVWMWVAGQIIVGAAIWGGIRADIRGMHMRIEHAEKAATEAHNRIDRLLERGH